MDASTLIGATRLPVALGHFGHEVLALGRSLYLDEIHRLASVPSRTLLLRGKDARSAISDASASYDLPVTGGRSPGRAGASPYNRTCVISRRATLTDP